MTLHNRFRLNVARCRKKITDYYRNRQPLEYFFDGLEFDDQQFGTDAPFLGFKDLRGFSDKNEKSVTDPRYLPNAVCEPADNSPAHFATRSVALIRRRNRVR